MKRFKYTEKVMQINRMVEKLLFNRKYTFGMLQKADRISQKWRSLFQICEDFQHG